MLRGNAAPAPAPQGALHAYLDRVDAWRSLGATMKLKIRIDNESVVACGHLMYLLGERYEIGFTKPYNRFLGNFYVTPEQLLYWDTHAAPHAFTLQDTVALGQLIALDLPNWDPRDMLPFPISGRSGGFQTDSAWTEGRTSRVRGYSGNVTYVLSLAGAHGVLTEERLYRAGRDPLIKRFDRVRWIHGWPVATRATCSNESGTVRFTWSLGRVSLDSEEYSTHGSTSGSDAAEPAPGH
jgi:hypothetical protein